jgi:TonB family protein
VSVKRLHLLCLPANPQSLSGLVPVLASHCAEGGGEYAGLVMPAFSRVWRRSLSVLAAIFLPLSAWAASESSDVPAPKSALESAICPIVYPVDQSSYDSKPPGRGIHFLFYGNGFFINKFGYLLTAAHVLSQLHGGEAYVLVHSASAPARILPARLVVVDIEHDVAILRATPNPFLGKYEVSFLSLSAQWPARSSNVMASALIPSNLKDPHTGDSLLEKDPGGQVLDYEFSALSKGQAETEMLLFSHEIEPGQSGSPVVTSGTESVVGLVEGRWLRENATTLSFGASSASRGIGAAIPIHYAISLLQQKGIAWQRAPEISSAGGDQTDQPIPPSLPVPLSIVTAPYPPQSLTGGEVVLDVLVDETGRLAQIRLIRGEDPFLFNVLAAIRTWTFLPGLENGRAVPVRIGIAFQFPQSLKQGVSASAHTFEVPVAHAGERSALPTVTVEPELPAESAAEGSVILYDTVDAQGNVLATRVLESDESLTPAALTAAQHWQFAPGMQAAATHASATILVFTFRCPPHSSQPRRAASRE